MDYNLLDHLFDPQFTVGRARRVLDIRNNALSTRFRDHFGITAAKYVERRRIETADRMYRSSDVPVGRVGQEVGFGSRSTFYDAYERVTGEKLKDVKRRSAVPEVDYQTWRRWMRGELTDSPRSP